MPTSFARFRTPTAHCQQCCSSEAEWSVQSVPNDNSSAAPPGRNCEYEPSSTGGASLSRWRQPSAPSGLAGWPGLIAAYSGDRADHWGMLRCASRSPSHPPPTHRRARSWRLAHVWGGVFSLWRRRRPPAGRKTRWNLSGVTTSPADVRGANCSLTSEYSGSRRRGAVSGRPDAPIATSYVNGDTYIAKRHFDGGGEGGWQAEWRMCDVGCRMSPEATVKGRRMRGNSPDFTRESSRLSH